MASKVMNISIVIPAFGRVAETEQLFCSILESDVYPQEVVVREDCSPQRNELRELSQKFSTIFQNVGIKYRYFENPTNYGYDRQLRELIADASCDYVMLMGNDDMLLKHGIAAIAKFINLHPGISFISRAFDRFDAETNKYINTWSFNNNDGVYCLGDLPAGKIFRLVGFVSGLVVNRAFALKLSTDKYDGSLYYQYYLGSSAYFLNSLGYISTPVVKGRDGNPPLFGSTAGAKSSHIPGSYTAGGRCEMWIGLLSISRDLATINSYEHYYEEIVKELSGRQSVHILEMTSRFGRGRSIELFKGLRKIGLTNSFIPWSLVVLILFTGRATPTLLNLVRKSIARLSK